MHMQVHFSPADCHAAITIVDSINSSNESKSNKAGKFIIYVLFFWPIKIISAYSINVGQ